MQGPMQMFRDCGRFQRRSTTDGQPLPYRSGQPSTQGIQSPPRVPWVERPIYFAILLDRTPMTLRYARLRPDRRVGPWLIGGVFYAVVREGRDVVALDVGLERPLRVRKAHLLFARPPAGPRRPWEALA